MVACMHGKLPQLCLFSTLWTVALQAPLSMGFSRQEYWSGLPFPPPGNLPNPGIKPESPALQADSLLLVPPGKPQQFHISLLKITGKLRFHYFLPFTFLPLFALILYFVMTEVPSEPGIKSVLNLIGAW